VVSVTLHRPSVKKSTPCDAAFPHNSLTTCFR